MEESVACLDTENLALEEIVTIGFSVVFLVDRHSIELMSTFPYWES